MLENKDDRQTQTPGKAQARPYIFLDFLFVEESTLAAQIVKSRPSQTTKNITITEKRTDMTDTKKQWRQSEKDPFILLSMHFDFVQAISEM